MSGVVAYVEQELGVRETLQLGVRASAQGKDRGLSNYKDAMPYPLLVNRTPYPL